MENILGKSFTDPLEKILPTPIVKSFELYLHNDTKIYLRLNQNALRLIAKKRCRVSPLTRKECATKLGVMYL